MSFPKTDRSIFKEKLIKIITLTQEKKQRFGEKKRYICRSREKKRNRGGGTERHTDADIHFIFIHRVLKQTPKFL